MKKGFWEWLFKVFVSNPAKHCQPYQYFCRWHPPECFIDRREYPRKQVSGSVEVTDAGIKIKLHQPKEDQIVGNCINSA